MEGIINKTVLFYAPKSGHRGNYVYKGEVIDKIIVSKKTGNTER